MESNSKNIDCYFYYYSECLRANQCKFRHEPSALGVEVMCAKWKEGNCTNQHCNLRHMELKKKRKQIPCYWEKQPGGCRKAHCAFQHQTKDSQQQGNSVTSTVTEGVNKDQSSDSCTQDWTRQNGGDDLSSKSDADSADAERQLNRTTSDSYGGPAVDPLVVNFEEESDSESAPTWIPMMPKEKDILHVKTLEEIRLEKVQAESAAYWEGIAGGPLAWEASNPAANPSVCSRSTSPAPRKVFNSHLNSTCTNSTRKNSPGNSTSDFRVLTLDEIRKNRARKKDNDGRVSDIHSDEADDNSILTKVSFFAGQNSKYSKNVPPDMSDLRRKLRTNSEIASNFSKENSRDYFSSKRQRPISPDDGPMRKSPDGPIRKQRYRRCKFGEYKRGNLVMDELEIRSTSLLADRQVDSGLQLEPIEENILNDIDKLLMD